MTLWFGEKIILDEFSYAFSKREKIGLVGPNGAGKTTFLKTLMCEIPLDSGWVSVGETIQFGYYSQVATFDDKADLKVADYVKAIEGEARSVVGGFGGLLKGVSAYKLLERFNFSGPRQMTSISQLSGGEKRRLQLLSVMALAPNFLILDEPTNDLDLDTIEALEDMLFDFDGCVLVVSHDRAFVNNLVDHIFVFDGQGNVNDWYGDYDSLRRHLKKNTYIPSVSDVDIKTAKEREALIAKEEVERAILKEAYNAPSVVQKIERALAVLDEAVAAIDVKLIHCGSDANAAHEVQKERDLKVAKQDTYYAEWERLERIMAEAEEIKAAREAI
jgi:ABC transport system ATP-binding/permease protein